MIDSAGVTSNILHSLVLGVVQGLTEFLPISSSAHLILVPRFLGWPDQGLPFDVALHLGTLGGVLAYFWRDLWDMLRLPDQRKTIIFLIAGTIPAALAGLFLEHQIETAFRSPLLIAGTVMIFGCALAAADYLGKGNKTLKDINLKSAIGIGLAQSLALVPGVSRSGVTITTALALGFARQDAARFSFLLSIPVIAGAGALKAKAIFHSPDHAAIAAGFVAAAASGFFAIWFLIRYVQTRRYTPFVVYRILLGLFILMMW